MSIVEPTIRCHSSFIEMICVTRYIKFTKKSNNDIDWPSAKKSAVLQPVHILKNRIKYSSMTVE